MQMHKKSVAKIGYQKLLRLLKKKVLHFQKWNSIFNVWF